MEKITLYFRQGSSDKVYQASIEPKNGKFLVNFAYGRRGSTLVTGTKTSTAVEYAQAKAIFDKLVKEKTSKGYTPGEDGTPYQHTNKEHTGIHCQLLNPIEEADLPRFIQDPVYWLQEKHDGRRLLIQKCGDTITGINKLGLTVAVPQTIEEAAKVFKSDYILDGETVGDVLHAFDILSLDGELITGRAYTDRYLNLMNLLFTGQQRHIKFVESAYMPKQKQEKLDELRKRGKEGVVLKHLNAPYTPNRPASGGSQFKFKFCESASFIVGKSNGGKRSVSLKLFSGTDLVSVGNCTIPANKEIPKADDVVEVRYLYAFKGGSIFQPVYLDKRDDVKPAECGVEQLKYKAEPQPQAA